MKNMSLAIGAAIIALANAFALIHVARNRMGPPDSDITLTNRELSYFARLSSEEDSGVWVTMRWTEPHMPMLNQEKLKSLGFDCSVSPASGDADRFYQRQRPRQAFIALEYEGAAWQGWLEEHTRQLETRKNLGQVSYSPPDASRLVPIDAGLDAVALRGRYPNRSSVIILPTVIGIRRNNYSKRSAFIEGFVLDLNRSIHMPQPFSDLRAPSYTIRLRYGSLHEPSVVAVTFPKQSK